MAKERQKLKKTKQTHDMDRRILLISNRPLQQQQTKFDIYHISDNGEEIEIENNKKRKKIEWQDVDLFEKYKKEH